MVGRRRFPSRAAGNSAWAREWVRSMGLSGARLSLAVWTLHSLTSFAAGSVVAA